jgi:hypothetical protein
MYILEILVAYLHLESRSLYLFGLRARGQNYIMLAF